MDDNEGFGNDNEDTEESSTDDFEDFDPEDYLDEEDTEELDFDIDESYRGDPDNQTLQADVLNEDL